uniref:Uncharacterized protein n=1 Tax=Setaria italica TaxID=4555 RepID=K3ZYN7_SETIT
MSCRHIVTTYQQRRSSPYSRVRQLPQLPGGVKTTLPFFLGEILARITATARVIRWSGRRAKEEERGIWLYGPLGLVSL